MKPSRYLTLGAAVAAFAAVNLVEGPSQASQPRKVPSTFSREAEDAGEAPDEGTLDTAIEKRR